MIGNHSELTVLFLFADQGQHVAQGQDHLINLRECQVLFARSQAMTSAAFRFDGKTG